VELTLRALIRTSNCLIREKSTGLDGPIDFSIPEVMGLSGTID
jgi:hypothetical protein